MKKSALVVIDLQNDITKNYRGIIAKVNEAIDWAVQKGLHIVYIRHNNLSEGTRTFKPGTRDAELVPELKAVSDYIFTKSKSNALTSEAFADFIKEHDIDEFYIVGADAAACIKSTCFNMTKRSCRNCLPIMKARDAPLCCFKRLWENEKKTYIFFAYYISVFCPSDLL